MVNFTRGMARIVSERGSITKLSNLLSTFYTLSDVKLNREPFTQVVDIQRVRRSFFCVVLVMVATVFSSVTFVRNAGAEAVSPVAIELDVIAMIESGGERVPDKACSYRGCEYGKGRYQVSDILRREWNQFHKNEQYEPHQLFDPQVNERIARWYLNVRIPQMLKHYGRVDGKDYMSLPYVLTAYNAGISYVRQDRSEWPRETVSYINRYMSQVQRLS